MSLETNIQELTAVLKSLVAAIETSKSPTFIYKDDAVAQTGQLELDFTAPEPEAAVEPAVETTEAEQRIEIVDLCLLKVRSDPKAKDKIKKLFKKYDPKAELVKDVPADKLSSLKADLDGLTI